MKRLFGNKMNKYLQLVLLMVMILAGLTHRQYSVTANSSVGEGNTDGSTRMIGSLITELSPWKPVAIKQVPGEPGFRKFYDVASCGEHLFAGSNIGLFILVKNIKNWGLVPEPFPKDKIVSGLAFTDDECKDLFAAVDGAGVWRGTLVNDVWSWAKAGDKSPDYDGAWDVVVKDNKVFATGQFGIRWADISDTREALAWKETNIKKLTVSLSDSNDRLLAAVWLDGVYTLLPDATDWTKVSGDPPAGQSLVHEAAANSTGIVAGTQTGLLFAPTAGNWSLVTTIPAPEQPTFAAIADGEDIYVGRLNPRVHKTTDGITWTTIPAFPDLREDGAQGFQVRGFDVGLTDGQLYAATTSGVWRLFDTIP